MKRCEASGHKTGDDRVTHKVERPGKPTLHVCRYCASGYTEFVRDAKVTLIG
jgi:hypothetical protein